MNTFNFFFNPTSALHHSRAMGIDLGYSIWKFVVDRDGIGEWHLLADYCKPGACPVGPPREPGEFDGHLRALPCILSERAIKSKPGPGQDKPGKASK